MQELSIKDSEEQILSLVKRSKGRTMLAKLNEQLTPEFMDKMNRVGCLVRYVGSHVAHRKQGKLMIKGDYVRITY